MFPYSADTAGVVVRVAVSFIEEASDPSAGRWMWSYHIRIENHRSETIQLIDRRWEIRDGRGATHVVEGLGVVGDQPVLEPGQSYDYVSGCPLTTPTGSMEGSYTFERADGSALAVRIPFFPLAAPAVAG